MLCEDSGSRWDNVNGYMYCKRNRKIRARECSTPPTSPVIKILVGSVVFSSVDWRREEGVSNVHVHV